MASNKLLSWSVYLNLQSQALFQFNHVSKADLESQAWSQSLKEEQVKTCSTQIFNCIGMNRGEGSQIANSWKLRRAIMQ